MHAILSSALSLYCSFLISATKVMIFFIAHKHYNKKTYTYTPIFKNILLYVKEL